MGQKTGLWQQKHQHTHHTAVAMTGGWKQVISDLQQDPRSSVLSTDEEAVFVQRTSHLHLVIPAAEDTRHALQAEDRAAS